MKKLSVKRRLYVAEAVAKTIGHIVKIQSVQKGNLSVESIRDDSSGYGNVFSDILLDYMEGLTEAEIFLLAAPYLGNAIAEGIGAHTVTIAWDDLSDA